mmetsp:Transcript_9498/g.22400  ORF Transcript_9498/g.22400 Transcript_9498/m.22400 type:complete len:131 (+) Transcript_9498:235-627(+)
MLGIGGLLVGVRWFCGEAGREFEPERWVEPNGEAGRLLERVPAVGAVAGRGRRMEFPPSPRISALARTGPPRKAPMPEPPLGALLTGTWLAANTGPAGAEARTPPSMLPGVGVVDPRVPLLGYRSGDSPR